MKYLVTVLKHLTHGQLSCTSLSHNFKNLSAYQNTNAPKMDIFSVVDPMLYRLMTVE